MVTTIKITGDGVFIQSNGGVGGGAVGAGARLQQQQEQRELLVGDNPLGSTAIGEASLPLSEGSVHNGSAPDVVDSSGPGPTGANDTNNNHKGYRNFNHRRYQSDEGPGFIGLRNGKPDRTAPTPSSTSDTLSGEGEDTIGEPDTSRKRDKFTISFLNTHRSSGGNGLPTGGKSMLNHKFIVYNSKKPKTSSVLHQQYYQQSIAAASNGAELGSGSGSPPLPYQSHYQQYLYNRLRPSLSTSVLSSPSLISAATATAPTTDPRDRLEQQQQQQLYQNGLFHQQHRALLGTPPAAIPGWAKSTSCLVSSSSATATYRSVAASPQPTGGTTPRPVPASSSSISSLSSSPSTFSAAGSPPSSGASSSSNTPPPPPLVSPSSSGEVPASKTPANATTLLPASSSTCNVLPPTTTTPDAAAPSSPTHVSPPPSAASNLG
uniref:Uncharacterized protein n=1 Tax=Anopheles epiroticus TaxID=199890 RepID=A0A182PF24_9DIPT